MPVFSDIMVVPVLKIGLHCTTKRAGFVVVICFCVSSGENGGKH